MSTQRQSSKNHCIQDKKNNIKLEKFVHYCLFKTFPILCTIYNKVVTKYSSVLNCKTVLR